MVLTMQVGCSQRVALHKDELVDPEPADSYLVKTRDGQRLTFTSLHLEGEWLLGTARITTTETVGEGEDARTNVTNRYEEVQIAWDDVESVEADLKKKSTSNILLLAGGVAVGIVAVVLLSGGSSDPESGDGGGKDF